ncbi:MAG: E3 ubiquitin protein ligase [Anaerolineales bacterium]|nr:E3 ubiquitin protein ligase [Anaerolineales bacterium]
MTDFQTNPICLICKEEIKPQDSTITCSKCGNIYHQIHNVPCPYHSTPAVPISVGQNSSRSGTCLGISISIGTALLLLVVIAGAILFFAISNGAFSKPNISNVYMASNENGDVQNTSYSPSQDFFVSFDLNDAPNNITVKSVWYAVDVNDIEPNTIISEYEDNFGNGSYYFQLWINGGGEWPTGKYKVEIYLNDTLEATEYFSVN